MTGRCRRATYAGHAWGPVAALLLAAAACDGAAERAADPAAAPPSSAPADTGALTAPEAFVTLERYIAEAAQAHGLTRAQLIARLGEPDSVGSMPVPNRHDPAVTDSVVQLLYPGARYTYYVVSAGPGEILDEARISSKEHLRHARPGIGSPESEVRAAFGAPTAARAGQLEYECRTCEVPEPVTFVLGNGRVSEIRFDYYVD